MPSDSPTSLDRRLHWTRANASPDATLRPVRVTIAAGFTAEMWEPYLGAACLDARVHPTFTYAP